VNKEDEKLLNVLDVLGDSLETLKLPRIAHIAATSILADLRADLIASIERRHRTEQRLFKLELEMGRTLGRIEVLERAGLLDKIKASGG
jgi:hypothetical protein